MTLTKSWLQKQITDLEATRDEIPFGLDEDGNNTLAALKMALAGMEAEAVYQMRLLDGSPEENLWIEVTAEEFNLPLKDPSEWDKRILYTEPQPATVVPTFDEWLEISGNKPLGWVKDVMRESYEACRAAMLQGGKS